MTATQPAPLAITEQLIGLLRRAGTWVFHAIIAVAIIMVAGFVAIATATAGLALAVFALLMRVIGRSPIVQKAPRQHTAQDGTITLEARETPRGWTVE